MSLKFFPGYKLVLVSTEEYLLDPIVKQFLDYYIIVKDILQI